MTIKQLTTLAFFVLTLLTSISSWAGIMDELTADQRKMILNGQQVVVTQDVSGFPWPKMFIYQKIQGSPEDSMAVTMDYPLRLTYTPDLKKAEVSKIVDSTTTDVDYTIAVPVISDENFTLEYHVSTYDIAASYRIDWHLVRADRTKRSDGFTRFEALGSDTIMAVYSFIDPNVSGASWVKKKAVEQAAGAVTGFSNQMTKEITSQPDLLTTQITALRNALSSP